MSRYDGLIIPRSYSEYLNKTDSATLSQMLQHLTGLWSHAVSAGDQKPVTSDAVYEAFTDPATIQQALQLPGVLSDTVAAGDNKAVTSDAVNSALAKYQNCIYYNTLQTQSLNCNNIEDRACLATASFDEYSSLNYPEKGLMFIMTTKTDRGDGFQKAISWDSKREWNRILKNGVWDEWYEIGTVR